MEQEEMTIKLLKTIYKNPNQSQRELAKIVGVSVGKTNYIIKALIKKGLIKTENFLNSTQLMNRMNKSGESIKIKLTDPLIPLIYCLNV